MYECMNGLILYGFVYVFIIPVVNYRIDEEKRCNNNGNHLSDYLMEFYHVGDLNSKRVQH